MKNGKVVLFLSPLKVGQAGKFGPYYVHLNTLYEYIYTGSTSDVIRFIKHTTHIS